MAFAQLFLRSCRVAALLSAPLIASAGSIDWTNPRVEQVASFDQEKAEAAFRFKNNSQQKIAIVDIRTSCGCTTATLEQRVFGPGEEGEIKAVFNLAGRSGMQEKVIEVVSDDSPSKPMKLVFSVSIPEVFVIEPRLLIWKLTDDSPVVEQSAILTAIPQIKLSVHNVRSENPDFEAKLITEQDGQRYKIVLRPKLPIKEGRTTIRIQLEGPPGHSRTASIYGLVK